MKKYKIFVSSNQKELKAERSAVKELICENMLLKDYFTVFLFEDSPAKGKPAKSIYLGEVRNSDIYIGLLGYEYGAIKQDGISATEKEFQEAQKCNQEILFFIRGSDDVKRDKQIQKLIAEIKNEKTGYKYKRFGSVLELKNNIYESLIEFLREKGVVGKTVFDRSVCEGTSFEDIDVDKVRWFLRVAKERRKYPLPENTPVKDVFAHLNLLNGGKLNNAAILLFGKDPHRFHLQAETKCLQFSGTEVEKPFLSYHIYSGNLFEQVDRAVAFVLSSIHLPVIQQKHTAQVKRPPEIPSFVIQEAIVNAIAHRDYNNNAGVQVMIFLDRVEVWNPGTLPAQLTIADLKKPHHSCPYNPLLAEVFYLADYIQKAGSGTLEMIKQCREYGLPEPEFISLRGYEFRTILARDIYTERLLIKLGLNERQKKAIKYIKDKGLISRKDYVTLTSVSPRQANKDFAELLKKKVIIQTGRGRSVKYLMHD